MRIECVRSDRLIQSQVRRSRATTSIYEENAKTARISQDFPDMNWAVFGTGRLEKARLVKKMVQKWSKSAALIEQRNWAGDPAVPLLSAYGHAGLGSGLQSGGHAVPEGERCLARYHNSVNGALSIHFRDDIYKIVSRSLE
jgi:hypothetical protein